MPDVQRGNIEAELQGRHADYEVLEWYGYALNSLFPFDASDYPSHLDRNRMDRHVAAQPIDESQATLLVRICFRTICTVYQFGDRYDR